MGPGIGMSVAKRFGKAGFEILMVARSVEKLREFEAELQAEGIRARAYTADIAEEETFQALLRHIAAEHADIEILHYNASAYNPATPSQISLPVFMNDLKINVVGAVLAVQAVFGQMKNRGRGVIFFTGGGSAFKAPANLASLGVGKAAIRNLTFSVAEEGLPYGIRTATITISGMVKAGTPFDPDIIAGKFWEVYQRPAGDWETEVVLQ